MTLQNEYVATLPLVLDEVEVVGVERVSPSFVRVELGGPAVGRIGVDGALYDQRFKVIFPNAAGRLPSFADATEDWWSTWTAIPEPERGVMRTYTIRDLVGEGNDTRLVVDIVVHEDDEPTQPDDASGSSPAAAWSPEGAGNRWALQAAVGQRLMVLAPRRGHAFGGIEWAPDGADRLLLVGDETAVPAIRGVLRDLPADATGAVFLEVPLGADVLDDVRAPEGVSVHWLPRDGAARGELVHAAVLAHLTGTPEAVAAAAEPVVADDEVDPELWETPAYSSSGEEVVGATSVPADTPYAGLYAWIAGESKVVTGLRRILVKDLGLDRGQVAFMGYWREGVAMRS
ncbi:siderophore-interacting protein [Nocardioides faecalis]|uniref:siderophore-interacting protein n=1 Tax=Nocardioides faecalis TaxID=2803858 RepID=UPI002016BE6A|nr:siderophore-interacting protein [Nocardioides faecalis]